MKKLLVVFFVFAMFSCEKAMDDVQPFQTENEEFFGLKSDTATSTNPNGGTNDDDDLIVDP